MPGRFTIRPGALGPGYTLAHARGWLTRMFQADARRRWHARWENR